LLKEIVLENAHAIRIVIPPVAKKLFDKFRFLFEAALLVDVNG
jgi:hypothetical protein